MRILIAEDDEAIRETMEFMLQTIGFRDFLSVVDGQAAWEKLEAENFDVLITDLDMPKMNGYELVKQIRAAGNNIPVIVRSASEPEEIKKKFDGLNVLLILDKCQKMSGPIKEALEKLETTE